MMKKLLLIMVLISSGISYPFPLRLIDILQQKSLRIENYRAWVQVSYFREETTPILIEINLTREQIVTKVYETMSEDNKRKLITRSLIKGDRVWSYSIEENIIYFIDFQQLRRKHKEAQDRFSYLRRNDLRYPFDFLGYIADPEEIDGFSVQRIDDTTCYRFETIGRYFNFSEGKVKRFRAYYYIDRDKGILRRMDIYNFETKKPIQKIELIEFEQLEEAQEPVFTIPQNAKKIDTTGFWEKSLRSLSEELKKE